MSIEDILMPGGNPIGVKATGPRASSRSREVTGRRAEAERIFQELTQGGKDITPPGYPGKSTGFQEWAANDRCQRRRFSGPADPIEKIKFVD